MASSLSNAEPKLSVPLQPDQTHQAQRGAGVRLKLFVGPAAIGIGLIDAIFTKSEDSDAGVNFAVSAKLIDRVLSAWADKSDVFTH